MYEMIFKRKSFRRFNDDLKLTKEEIDDIKEKIEGLKPLIEEIEFRYKIVKRSETTCKRGEYCILIYSENKDGFLLNIGYIFEQLDLYLASKNIGVCWYGMGKTEEKKFKGLDFVIMLAIGKAKAKEFRRDYTKCKRKETREIWSGTGLEKLGEVVKYAPSACNTQPWLVTSREDIIKIYRRTDIKSIMPKDKVPYYNSIDLGIFLYFLELVMEHNKIVFDRTLLKQEGEDLISIAKYKLL